MAELATPMAIRVAALLSLVEHAGEAAATVRQLVRRPGRAGPRHFELTALAAASGLAPRDTAVVADERTALEFTPA